MHINSLIINELFRAFNIQRWNDRVRPMDLYEMDKHAQKFLVAYILGRYEEREGRTIDWHTLIKHGIFELLRRIVISDIKSPIFAAIRKNKEAFSKLNRYVVEEISPKIAEDAFRLDFENYILNESESNTLEHQILNAAHIYASYWEFQIIRQSNPTSYQNVRIETELLKEIHSYKHLLGIKNIISKHTVSNFIDLCGQLRFQVRWAQTPRLPRTTVLGHSLLVACIAYLFTREQDPCPKRIYNNFFGGLFHDLPEAVTRDIISPVKRSSIELDNLIKSLERELAEKEIFPLIDDFMVEEIKYYIQDEFENKVIIDANIKTGNIDYTVMNKYYNSDEYSPYDGVLIRAADHFATFLEAWRSRSYGISSEELLSSAKKIRESYV